MSGKIKDVKAVISQGPAGLADDLKKIALEYPDDFIEIQYQVSNNTDSAIVIIREK